jgi:hypothetical protein
MNPDLTTPSDVVQKTIITRPSPFISAFVACIAAVSVTTLLHPLDLIKTRWQGMQAYLSLKMCSGTYTYFT